MHSKSIQQSTVPTPELVPRLDRWLASELIKGLKGVPDLQFKVQGYIERCTRNGTAPRGRAVFANGFSSF